MIWTAKEIKDLRWRLGWSQAEFGRRLGLSLTSMSELEHGTLEVGEDISDQLLVLSTHLESYCKNIKASSLSNQHCKNSSKTQASTAELEEFAKPDSLK